MEPEVVKCAASQLTIESTSPPDIVGQTPTSSHSSLIGDMYLATLLKRYSFIAALDKGIFVGKYFGISPNLFLVYSNKSRFGRTSPHSGTGPMTSIL